MLALCSELTSIIHLRDYGTPSEDVKGAKVWGIEDVALLTNKIGDDIR